MPEKTVTELKSIACAAIDEACAELHQLSKTIWSTPELNYQEKQCHDTLCNFLEKYNFHTERHYKLETAFRGTVGEKVT